MANNSNQDRLLQLRSQIDEIDDSLINLLNKRIGIVKEVGKYKRSINESFFVKSAREADMIKDLLIKSDPSIPKSTIVNIWRKIIASANFLEQDLNISIFNPHEIADYQYLVREYYGDFIPFSENKNSAQILSDIKDQKSQIGVFCSDEGLENEDNIWWKNLAHNKNEIQIFARIPFVGTSKYQLFVCAIKAPEKSSDDKTLLVIQSSDIDSSLKESGFNFKILQSSANFHLIEIDGFFKNSDQRINNIPAKFIKTIGHFANSIN
ncbi:MAG: chorismate mutase [Rickettsiales bacterium]|jgi:chorismate mutase